MMKRHPVLLRRLLFPLLTILLASLAWFAWQRFSLPGPAGADGSAARVAGPEAFLGPPGSLAVLPFVDDSPGRDQAALAYGFSADLLARLEQLPGLRVTARNSAFYFRDPAVPRQVVAARLQARLLLTGSWRAEQDALRVTVALYDARREAESWRQDFGGETTHWPALREAVVAAVREQLPTAAASPPDELPEARSLAGRERYAAWSNWAQGLFLADPLGPADLDGAAAAFRRALEPDPLAPRPLLALAELWLHPGWAGVADGQGVERARSAVLEVLDESPGDPAALVLLSHIRRNYDWDWAGAAAAGRAAVAAAGDARAATVAGLAELSLGDFDAAVANFEAAVQRDPLNLGTRLSLGLAHEFQEDYEAALATYRQLLVLNPDYPAARAFRARVKALQGKGESALREAEQEADPFWRRYARVLAMTPAAGSPDAAPDEAGRLLADMIASDGAAAAYQVAELKAWGGDVDGAFEWLQRAVAQRDGGIASLLGDPLLQGLHDDPRWKTLLENLRLPLD